ncbi:MAG: hypothetical protein G3I10_04660 [Ferrovum sp.]|nr:hypothetical protein [Ferrovum sp.]
MSGFMSVTAYRIALPVLIGFWISGCATIQPYQQSTQDQILRPLKVMLVQTPMGVDDATLRDLFAPDLAKNSLESLHVIENTVSTAQAHASADLQSAIETQAGINISSSESLTRVINELRINNADTVITREMAKQLSTISGANALLRFRITDYGATPKSWHNAVIVFEVTSTLGITAIAYAKPATRAIAGAYLATESIEETAEAYTGFWALDEVCRPVRIEAELVMLDTGTQAWRGSATGFSDVGLTRLVRKVSNVERDMQLDNAVQDAVNGIVADLRKVLSKHQKE